MSAILGPQVEVIRVKHMKLRYAILYVPDVRKALEFYRKAFSLEQGFLHESNGYGELETGETKLAFSSSELMASLGKKTGTPNTAAPSFEIAFETEDVDAAVKSAEEAGATVIQHPRDEKWGQRTAYLLDPFGFTVEVCTAVKSS